MGEFPHQISEGWRASLCGCWEDPCTCCRVCCCLCVAYGQIAHVVKRGDETVLGLCTGCCLVTICCACSYWTCNIRFRLRDKYGLPQEPCNDWCVDCFCLPCSLVQQYRELRYRGIDPGLGWESNKQTYERSISTQTTPPVEQVEMSRLKS